MATMMTLRSRMAYPHTNERSTVEANVVRSFQITQFYNECSLQQTRYPGLIATSELKHRPHKAKPCDADRSLDAHGTSTVMERLPKAESNIGHRRIPFAPVADATAILLPADIDGTNHADAIAIAFCRFGQRD